MRLLQPTGLHQSVACWLTRGAHALKGFSYILCTLEGIAADGCEYDCNQLDPDHQCSHAARAEKAKKVFPRPTAGPLRPIVHGQTIKYNLKKRLGRGFTFEELKASLASPLMQYLLHRYWAMQSRHQSLSVPMYRISQGVHAIHI